MWAYGPIFEPKNCRGKLCVVLIYYPTSSARFLLYHWKTLYDDGGTSQIDYARTIQYLDVNLLFGRFDSICWPSRTANWAINSWVICSYQCWSKQEENNAIWASFCVGNWKGLNSFLNQNVKKWFQRVFKIIFFCTNRWDIEVDLVSISFF